jgi:hypothetical protein
MGLGSRDGRALARTVRRGDLASLRAAVWALRAAHGARRVIRDDGIAALSIPPPPELPAKAGRGVNGVLRRSRYSCLEQAVVRQAWAAAHGDARDVIIGVSSPADFGAHAWLEGDPPSAGGGFLEIVRHPAPAVGGRGGASIDA